MLESLKPYLDPEKDKAYLALGNEDDRRKLRDLIVLSRVRAFDIAFADYEKGLWRSGNSVTVGGDLLVLALGGLATTVVTTSAKTGYAAASTGVAGANAAINRDLYYQRTLPALLAQMEANRAKAKAKILTGIKQSDANYSLQLAELDLVDLKTAGSMADAVGTITQQATTDKKNSQATVDELRAGTFSGSDTTKKLRTWIGNPPDEGRLAALQGWMSSDAIDPALQNLPPEVLIDLNNSQLESDRARAIAALHIP